MTRTPTYRSWQAAKERCHNPRNAKYPVYGGVGITMCDRWRYSFDAFFEDMGIRPEGMTLDRQDQTKGYEPGNVQWATSKQQSDNRGNSRAYRWRGMWMTRRDIASEEGIPYTSLGKALRKTNTIQAAVAYVKSRLGRSGIENLRPPS